MFKQCSAYRAYSLCLPLLGTVMIFPADIAALSVGHTARMSLCKIEHLKISSEHRPTQVPPSIRSGQDRSPKRCEKRDPDPPRPFVRRVERIGAPCHLRQDRLASHARLCLTPKQACSQERHSSLGNMWYFRNRAQCLPAEYRAQRPSPCPVAHRQCGGALHLTNAQAGLLPLRLLWRMVGRFQMSRVGRGRGVSMAPTRRACG